MTITNDHAGDSSPWYLMKSSIVMIAATTVAVIIIGFEYLTADVSAPAVFQLNEDGRIVNTDIIGPVQK